MSLMFSMLCLLSLAQTHQVSGIVKDVTGEPVIGVNVSVQGTGNGSITDLDGKFAIPNVKEKDVLIVSYIGYLTQSIPVGKQTSFTITLKEDAQALDEVVVEGIVWVKYLDGYVKFVCLWIIYGKVVHHVQKNLSVFVLEYLDAVFIGEVQWDILEIIFVCV